MEGLLLPIQPVKIRYPVLKTFVERIVQQTPVEAHVMIPLVPLPEFPSHEEEFFPGLSIHVSQKQPEIRELLPVIAGHLPQERPLAVNDLVMRQGQNEVFVIGVQEPKGEAVVMVLPVHGVFLHVLQGVVHPTHVPFHTEPQPSDVVGP